MGDLSRDIAADDTFPKSSNADILFAYVEECGACESCYKVFYEAWGMYERERVGEKLFRKQRNAYEQL